MSDIERGCVHVGIEYSNIDGIDQILKVIRAVYAKEGLLVSLGYSRPFKMGDSEHGFYSIDAAELLAQALALDDFTHLSGRSERIATLVSPNGTYNLVSGLAGGRNFTEVAFSISTQFRQNTITPGGSSTFIFRSNPLSSLKAFGQNGDMLTSEFLSGRVVRTDVLAGMGRREVEVMLKGYTKSGVGVTSYRETPDRISIQIGNTRVREIQDWEKLPEVELEGVSYTPLFRRAQPVLKPKS